MNTETRTITLELDEHYWQTLRESVHARLRYLNRAMRAYSDNPTMSEVTHEKWAEVLGLISIMNDAEDNR